MTQVNNSVVILIPAYKPGEELLSLVQKLKQLLLENDEILVVDDGSGQEYRHIFEQLENKFKIHVLRHAVNLGKGHALKTGFNEILVNFTQFVGVVTADADGQHLPEDILRVKEKLVGADNTLVLGARSFIDNVPFRSKFGNIVTSKISQFLLGQKITDTQTGLRGINLLFLNQILRLKSSGYDYEMEMLVAASELGLAISEVPISTVYIENNKSSHFSAFRDSLAIYFVLMRHTINSALTAVVDFIFFSLSFLLSQKLLLSLILGRLFAGTFNFLMGKKYVFRSKNKLGRELFLYSVLVFLLMFLSYIGIEGLVALTGWSAYLAKIVVEILIFFLSFSMQKLFVFKPREERLEGTPTNWDLYYDKRVSPASITRKISGKIILSSLFKVNPEPFETILEFGGGDSCFYSAFLRAYPLCSYIIVDKSPIGIEKFLKKNAGNKIEAINSDILAAKHAPLGSLVYSVGLIEHFNEIETARCIEAHFDACVSGGIVLISYPTPTSIYRFIRKIAEWLGVWNFPDERPLKYNEVSKEMSKYGKILLRKKNWFIGLTQELIIVRKF